MSRKQTRPDTPSVQASRNRSNAAYAERVASGMCVGYVGCPNPRVNNGLRCEECALINKQRAAQSYRKGRPTARASYATKKTWKDRQND